MRSITHRNGFFIFWNCTLDMEGCESRIVRLYSRTKPDFEFHIRSKLAGSRPRRGGPPKQPGGQARNCWTKGAVQAFRRFNTMLPNGPTCSKRPLAAYF